MNCEASHVINRIQKLLALGKSPNKAEAESAILKAHELLRNYNLRIEDISEESNKRIIDRHPFGKIQTRPKPWRMIIAKEISELNYCKLLIVESKNHVLFTIIGYEHNARTAICLIDYLYKTIERISRNECPKISKQKYRNSFRLGMAMAVIEKIRDSRKADNEDARCRALVIKTDEEISKYLENLKITSEPMEIDPLKAEAFSKGKKFGREVNLSKQIGGRVISR